MTSTGSSRHARQHATMRSNVRLPTSRSVAAVWRPPVRPSAGMRLAVTVVPSILQERNVVRSRAPVPTRRIRDRLDPLLDGGQLGHVTTHDRRVAERDTPVRHVEHDDRAGTNQGTRTDTHEWEERDVDADLRSPADPRPGHDVRGLCLPGIQIVGDAYA